MKKYITVIMLCMAAAFISACSSGKVADSKNLNAYERTLYIPTKEYPDTSVDTMVSFDEKCFYAECRFEDIDGKQKYVLKNIYEYNYATGETGKLDLLTDVEEYCGYCLTPDNNWLVYDPVNWDVSLRDAGHKVVAETNLQETSFPKTDEEKSRLNAISDVRCDENYVYISGKNKQNKATMLVFDMNLKEKNAFFADREWMFIPMQNNRIGLIDNKKGHIYTYNEEKNALEDVGKIPKNVLNASSTRGFCRGNAEYDYFYYTNGYGNEDDFSNLTQYQSLCEEDKSFLAGYETTLDLSRLLYFSGDRFLNEKTGEIHVKEEAFRSMLQFLKMQSACRHKNNNELLQYLDGEAYVPYVTIAEPIQYLHYNNWFHGNAVFTNVGTEGLVIGSRDGLLGVCTKSQHKEALYAFYDFLFEPSYYHTIAFSSYGLPVIKEEYELWKEYFLATEDYEDKYGEFHRKYDLEFGIGNSVIKVGSVSEQEAEEAITALQEANYIKPMKDAYENIITEEASAYFAGTQDLDRTCDNIENRLQLALEENKQ